MWPGQENEQGHNDTAMDIGGSKHAPLQPYTARRPDPVERERSSSISGVRATAASKARRNPSTSRPRLWSSDVGQKYQTSMTQDLGTGYSATSDKQLGHLSPLQPDRVFPVRSVVSVDPNQTPFMAPFRTSGDQDSFPGFSTNVSDKEESSPRYALGRSKSVASGHYSDGGSIESRKNTDSSPRSSMAATRQSQARSSMDAQNEKIAQSIPPGENDRFGGGSRIQIFSDSTSDKSTTTDQTSSQNNMRRLSSGGPGSVGSRDDQSNLGGLVTARFKHVVTEGGHAVITGRDGETLQRCEDEPIHIPGAVQSFGLLVAFREEGEEGNLVVRVVSENSLPIIGYTPQELFALESFTDILSEEQSDNLLDHIDFIRDEEADPATNGPEVFTLSVRNGKRKSMKLWCAMHINPVAPDTIICEFELEDDQTHPLVPTSEDTPELPEDTLNSQPTEEEFEESTRNTSKPLRVLRSARKRKGEAAAMEVFNIMSQVQEQLASAPNLDQFLKILVGVVKELTGFHRVMIYQFDSTFNGRVVTELVDPRATKDLYKGLNFPASDIPKQARELYKINKVRLLYDRDNVTARLVCRTTEDLENPLDLSFSYLRAMSPIHIKYLKNMAVRSSMSISINAFNELWGLIACHAYGPKGMRVSFPIRKMCRLVGDTASRNIERLSYASRLQARKLINTMPTEANPSGYIIASSDDLLKLFDADFGLLTIKGETKILGHIDQSQEALAMLEYLRLRNVNAVLTSQDIRQDFPDLRYQPGFSVIAGLLLVPLTINGNDFIVFFRRGQIKEVKWAGNPYEKFIKEGTEGYLEPRKSFKTWSETVVGKCREWTEEQVETAAVLCLVYGKFIEVWRQKEAALQSSQLTRLLLANSAHEVRTPLNAIINYLEIALEGALDQETRDNLAKSHSASKSLIYVINDLLDLTKTEEGQELIKDEVFDLPATVKEATEVFRGDAKRKGIEYEIIEHPGVPQYVYGDQRRVRQAVANITANAVQNTTAGWVKVELYLAYREGQRVAVDIVIEDSGVGMTNAKLDALFRDLEQVSTDTDEIFDGPNSPKANQLSFSGRSNSDSKPGGGRILGLGLALVARIVRNMEGQLRLKSEEGKGSRFVIQMPFDVPEDADNKDEEEEVDETPSSNMAALPPVTPPTTDGELLLINKSTPSSKEKVNIVSQRRSMEDFASLRSFKSGSSEDAKSNKSDVDRLIDAISGPLSVDTGEGVRPHRSNSKGSKASVNSRNSVASLGGNLGDSHRQASSSYGSFDRPVGLIRSKSFGAPEHLRTSEKGLPGTEYVTDNKTPLKAIRVPDEYATQEEAPPTSSRVLFDIPDKEKQKHASAEPSPNQKEYLEVLVAEDDPVNSRIVQKRLEKIHHHVHLTVNGEECASTYCEAPSKYAVVLMDMQMPIVDGLTSTKMIRSFEKSHPPTHLSPRAQANGRIPIFAVSASLVERERQTYINAGFDGWILKPIDFKRLNILLAGIDDEKPRNQCLYQPGKWEQGGWFNKRQPSVFHAQTCPSDGPAVSNPPPPTGGDTEEQPDQESLDSESTITDHTRKNQPIFYDNGQDDDIKFKGVIDEVDGAAKVAEDNIEPVAGSTEPADEEIRTAKDAAEPNEPIEHGAEFSEDTVIVGQSEEAEDIEYVDPEGEPPRTEKEDDAISERKVDNDRVVEDVTEQPET